MPVTAKSNDLLFECPHCHVNVEVSREYYEKIVDCPNCHAPFEVDVPEGRPIERIPGNDTKAEFRVEKELDDEAVVLELHPSMIRKNPFAYIGLVGVGAISLVVAIFALVSGQIVVSLTGLALAAVAAAYYGYWWLTCLYTTLSITNKRTTLRLGIIAKNTTEVQHDDVRNIQVHQNWWQRIMSVGDIAISSSGQDDLEIAIKGIPHPNDAVKTIRSMQ